MTERLKGETRRDSEIAATYSRERVLQLKLAAIKAEAEAPRPSATGLFKDVCSTDLLFLMDTTWSMLPHIKAAREQVMNIVRDIKVAFLNEAEVRMAVVGYKDHQDRPNIQFLDFTSSVDRVRSFIDRFIATGGGDEPEDVLGGLRKALNATWRHKTRCIIHIADAPPHGRTLHDFASTDDDYPTPGTEPHGLTHEPLLKQMLRLNINYALLRINSSTDRMAFIFFKAYAMVSGGCTLHPSNKYYEKSRSTAQDIQNDCSSGRNFAKAGGLLFEEAQLGTNFNKLRHLVVKMVTTSASRTAVRVSLSRTTKAWTKKKLETGLTAIGENEGDDDTVELDNTPPRWEMLTASWESLSTVRLAVEGFSLDVVVHRADTLDAMMANDDNIRLRFSELSIYRRRLPFAQGALRMAFYAKTAASKERFVVKTFKREGKRLEHLAEEMRCQALCKAFALEFSALLDANHPIDFIVTTCFKGKPGMVSETVNGDQPTNLSTLSQSLDYECMSLEPFIEGDYVKYNSNCGYVNDKERYERFSKAAQAFSHFTFERSKGRFLVSDLQGVGYVLTDPAIHTLDPERFKLADANLNEEGFKFFFARHVCNDICRQLKLQSNASMVMSKSYDFRTSWPVLDNTVCCSNKLCGRIVRMASAKRSEDFQGHYWCDRCWPQLSSSVVKKICVTPEPDMHKFEVSEFFYESQGRPAPRECPLHRVGDTVVNRPVMMNSADWDRLEPAELEPTDSRLVLTSANSAAKMVSTGHSEEYLAEPSTFMEPKEHRAASRLTRPTDPDPPPPYMETSLYRSTLEVSNFSVTLAAVNSTPSHSYTSQRRSHVDRQDIFGGRQENGRTPSVAGTSGILGTGDHDHSTTHVPTPRRNAERRTLSASHAGEDYVTRVRSISDRRADASMDSSPSRGVWNRLKNATKKKGRAFLTR